MLAEAQRNMLKHHYAVPSREASRRRNYFLLLDTSVITNDWSRLEAIITYESHSVDVETKKNIAPPMCDSQKSLYCSRKHKKSYIC